MKDAVLHELKDHEEPPKSAVAVGERVQRLELVVRGCGAVDLGPGARRVESAHPLVDSGLKHVARWRGDQAGFVDRQTMTSDEDLTVANASGVAQLTCRSPDERLLKFAEEAQGDGSVRDPSEGELRRPDVVQHLADFGGPSGLVLIQVGFEEIRERRIRALER